VSRKGLVEDQSERSAEKAEEVKRSPANSGRA